MLGVLAGGKDGFDQRGGLRTDLRGPAGQAFRGPFPGFLVVVGHMLAQGRVPAGGVAARVDRHRLSFTRMVDFHHPLGGPHAHFLVISVCGTE